jgi:hypothetical protein
VLIPWVIDTEKLALANEILIASPNHLRS